MTLENLLRLGKLRAHAADEMEIVRLLASAERALLDSSASALFHPPADFASSASQRSSFSSSRASISSLRR